MKFKITRHARKRMEKYGISESLVREGMESPDSVVEGHSGRKIAQLKLITTYKARGERYGI